MVVAGLLVRGIPGAVGDVAGGILYSVLIFLLIAVVVPAASAIRIGVGAFLVCAAVEALQLTGLPSALTEILPPLRYALGSTFAATDLVVYAVGAVCCVVADRVLRRRAG